MTEVQACPIRHGGTMRYDASKPENGLVSIDIADHKFNVVLPINEEEGK